MEALQRAAPGHHASPLLNLALCHLGGLLLTGRIGNSAGWRSIHRAWNQQAYVNPFIRFWGSKCESLSGHYEAPPSIRFVPQFGCVAPSEARVEMSRTSSGRSLTFSASITCAKTLQEPAGQSSAAFAGVRAALSQRPRLAALPFAANLQTGKMSEATCV